MSRPLRLPGAVPVASPVSERTINAALVTYPELAEDPIDLGQEDFFDEPQRIIFATISAILADRTRDLSALMVCEDLNRSGMLEAVGGQQEIFALGSLVGSQVAAAEALRNAAATVRGMSLRRRIAGLCEDFRADVSNLTLELDETVQLFQGAAADVLNRASDRHQSRSTYAEILSRVSSLATNPRAKDAGGLLTGIDQLDEAGVRIERKTLFIIGGRPGSGKSALAQQLIEHVAGQGYGCVFASLEMHRDQIGRRAIASETGIPMAALKEGSVRAVKPMNDAVARLSALDIEVDERPAQTLAYLRKWVIKRRREGETGKRKPLHTVAVDYCQIMGMSNSRAPRHEQINEVTRGLKILAKEQDVAVIALAQLNRNSEERSDKAPETRDLAGSDGITQDADVICLAHRVAADPKWKDRAEIIIGKVRDGATGVVSVPFDGARFRFGGWRKEYER